MAATDTPSVASALTWLDQHPGGASLVSFMQKLPLASAEAIHAASIELKRLQYEDEHHSKRAGELRHWGWSCGLIGFFGINAFGDHLSTAALILINIAFVAIVSWITTRAITNAHALSSRASAARSALNEKTFTQIGVSFNGTADTVRTISSILAEQRQLKQEVVDSRIAYEDILRGALLAEGKGVPSSWFSHRNGRLSPILGGLPTEELLEHPDCERVFREMVRFGLLEHTVEAIVLRSNIPVSSRTMTIAMERLQSAGHTAGR